MRVSYPETVSEKKNTFVLSMSFTFGVSAGFLGTLLAISAFALLVSHTPKAVAAPACEPNVGKAVSVQGVVEMNRAGQVTWQTVGQGETFCAGDSVRAASRSRAAILLANQTLIRLDEDTAISFSAIEPSEPSWMELLKGALHFLSRTRQSFKVKTPFVNAAIEGTEFMVRVTPAETGVWVYEGTVALENPQGSLTLYTSEAAVAEAGKAPVRRIIVDPRDAVQWALYYPPVIDYNAIARATGPDRPTIEAALAAYRRNDLIAALTRLNAVPVALRSSTYYTFHAGLLLSVGRVDQAQPDIDRALALDPASGTAYALRSIIALVRNEPDKALSLAKQGAQLDPQSSAPQVALSYAYQARFAIQQARDNASQAVSLSAEDALAWARLSELELSLGELDKALAAARQAVSLDPNIARTQTILGFANLTEIDIDEAKKAFQKAIALDQAAPLPRLGLGLVTIRAGHLDEGVRELEIAASLDPENSLIRSYLGKGYYEQKREKLAATEFEMAKQLDPKDPTPRFYDAILKQTTNRPVNALHEIQKAIELNDNRAVYRSRLLLDQDLAARTANVARIYDDLGFQQRALLEGWRSVNLNPSNYSGHRFLADTYAALPRHEIARASELLQAQLLQPINITPVQPQQAETNLLILDGAGPGNPSFNEFNPLFARNRAALQTSGVIGTESTLGDEAILSGLYDKVSGSLGQFRFQTDGFRENADLKQKVVDAFVQANISPKHGVEAEVRYKNTDTGDVTQRFRPENFSPNLSQDIEEKSFRFGYHFDITPDSDFIASTIYMDRNESQNDQFTNVSFGFPIDILKISNLDTDAFSAEVAFLRNQHRFNLIAGTGYYKTQNEFSDNQSDITDDEFIPLTSVRREFDTQDINLYLYSNVEYPKAFTWTLGISTDFHKDDRTSQFDTTQINPKIGLSWDITSWTTLRLSAFRILKRRLVVNQTIEPTQIAGFNQFFDDFNGTDAYRYGIGIDQQFKSDLLGGVEFSWRELTVPVQVSSDNNDLKFFKNDGNERLHRAYLYWTPVENLALSAEYFFEEISWDLNFQFETFTNPKTVETHRIPLGIRYFHPSGIFTQLRVSYIDQKVKFPLSRGGLEALDNQFLQVDAAVGYRLPKRWGIASLIVKNLNDEDFMFQDTDVAGDPRAPLFNQGRSVLLNVSFSF